MALVTAALVNVASQIVERFARPVTDITDASHHQIWPRLCRIGPCTFWARFCVNDVSAHAARAENIMHTNFYPFSLQRCD